MAYNVQYFMVFSDFNDVEWRVDLSLKDGPMTDMPHELQGDDEPLILDKRNNEESPFTAIISTSCTIKYKVNSDADPEPAIFVDVEADEWLISVYKSGSLYWRGFLDGKNSSYSWMPYPYSFSMTGNDFDFLSGAICDVNEGGILYYDFVSLGELINRTLFQAIPYDSKSLKLSYSKKPAVIASSQLTEGVYLHTDSIYSFTDGPIAVDIAIDKLVSSMGARIFFEDGSYWIQYIEDIGTESQVVITITPDNLVGTSALLTNYFISMGNGVFDGISYLGASQEGTVNRGLKYQEFIYDLKVINKLKNFDWRDNTHPPFYNWQNEPAGPSFYTRTGMGNASDNFRLIIPPGFDPDGAGLLSDVIPALRGQTIEVIIRNEAFVNFPVGSGQFPEDYKVTIQIIVTLADDMYFLNTSGKWFRVTSGVDNRMLIDATPGKGFSETIITSDPIPSDVPDSMQHVAVFIYSSLINPEPPVGTTYYTELYPISVGVFSNRYTKTRETITNNAKFSLKADDRELFYLDTQQDGYSNTLFYKDGSNFLPIPPDNWPGNKSIDETVVRQYMDMQAKATTSILGNFISGNLYFYQGILLTDKNGMRCQIIRDNYTVHSATHDLMCREILPEGAASAEYVIKSTNE